MFWYLQRYFLIWSFCRVQEAKETNKQVWVLVMWWGWWRRLLILSFYRDARNSLHSKKLVVDIYLMNLWKYKLTYFLILFTPYIILLTKYFGILLKGKKQYDWFYFWFFNCGKVRESLLDCVDWTCLSLTMWPGLWTVCL